MTPEQELDLRMADPLPGVVFLRVEFYGSPIIYTYAAVEVGGSWYLTGEETEGRTWGRLVDWLKTKQATVISLKRATSWEDIL